MKTTVLKKIINLAGWVFCVLVIVSAIDVLVLRKIFGFGYPTHYEIENPQRTPVPYVMFSGKPNVLDHNELGFRGPSVAASKPDDIKIAFFGGSTGYSGDPPIAEILETRLEDLLGAEVFVANYSAPSAKHRQHLHGIIEYLPRFIPDLVIFYGGFNETIQCVGYDPRPGYPYNYFYRSETEPFPMLLLKNSAIMGRIANKTGILTGLKKLREEQQPYSDDWNKRIAGNYFEVLQMANNVAGTFESRLFGNTEFMAFYQPYQVPVEFISTHQYIKEHIATLPYAFDVSSAYDTLGKKAYTDIIHVNQQARELMADTIAHIVARKFREGEMSNPGK